MEPSQQEIEAIQALRRGDAQGLEILVTLYKLQALRTAYALCGDLPMAEDAVADAFLAVYENIGQFDIRRPFAPWFYRIVVNRILKARRRSSRHVALDLSTAARRPDLGSNPEEEAMREELRLAVVARIMALHDKQRAVVVLRYYLEMKDREIAQTMQCPLGTVKWRLYVARKQLRTALAHGYDTKERLIDPQGETS